MLLQFDIKDRQQLKKLFNNDGNDKTPKSEAMKNSLLVIGNPNPNLKIREGRITDFGKTTISKFM